MKIRPHQMIKGQVDQSSYLQILLLTGTTCPRTDRICSKYEGQNVVKIMHVIYTTYVLIKTLINVIRLKVPQLIV